MSNLASAHAPLFDPLRLDGKAWPVKALFVLLGTGFLALSSQISVPMVPVPVTMQTFAITMIGVIYGWRLGVATVLTWLTEAMLGFRFLPMAPAVLPISQGRRPVISPPFLWSLVSPAGWHSAAGPAIALS